MEKGQNENTKNAEKAKEALQELAIEVGRTAKNDEAINGQEENANWDSRNQTTTQHTGPKNQLEQKCGKSVSDLKGKQPRRCCNHLN
jgi:hypothetical protein